MRKIFLTLSLLASTSAAFAEQYPLAPGLWEIRSQNTQVDGEKMPSMDDILADLAPEERKMMEQMMAQQGQQMPSDSVRICISEQDLDSDEPPFVSTDPDCTMEILERNSSVSKYRFQCPDNDGVAETRFDGRHKFSTHMETNIRGSGAVTIETTGKWLKAECDDTALRGN